MQAKEFISELKSIVLELEYASDMQGCSEEELQQWDQFAAGGKLPGFYREFLRTMGREIQGSYLGAYLFDVNWLGRIQEEGRKDLEFISKASGVTCPDAVFFFLTYDFVYYYYFLTDQDDPNPAVYHFSKTKAPRKAYTSLENFFRDEYGEVDCAL